MLGALDRFFVIDVETANADCSSICQVGIVEFCATGVANEWSTLVDPEDDFDWFNVSIHGIEPYQVRGAPTFPQLQEQLAQRLGAGLVLSYTWFDRSAVWRAHEKYSLAPPGYDWLDATRIVRRTWSEIAHGGYKLKKVARMLQIQMERHHDALSDARTAGLIVMEALRTSGTPLSDWRRLAYQPITPDAKAHDVFAGIDATEIDPNGPLAGETIAFTGQLSMTRKEVMALAYKGGAQVTDGVTKATTMLVVGIQDLQKLRGNDKSSKQKKAEKLVAGGQDISLLTERNFFDFVSKEPAD